MLQVEVVAQAALPTVDIATVFPSGPVTAMTAVQFRVHNNSSLPDQNAISYRLELIDRNSGEVASLLKSGDR